MGTCRLTLSRLMAPRMCLQKSLAHEKFHVPSSFIKKLLVDVNESKQLL